MPKSRASTDGAAAEAITEPATMPQEADPAPPATLEPKTGSAVAMTAPATKMDLEPVDGSFPSHHVIYLGVVRNELEASLMRFRNGHEMLRAKIEGTQTAHEDEMRMLKEEYDRKRQEKLDAHVNEIMRLKVQAGDLNDVIETYETSIGKIEEIVDRHRQAEAAADLKPEALK